MLQIRITKPELETLIRERMQSAPLQDLEEVFLKALQESSLPAQLPQPDPDMRTGKSLVDAMQSSPHKEIEIEPERLYLDVRAAEL